MLLLGSVDAGNNPDCMPYCNKSFVTAKNPGYDINRSDMDFWELGGPEGDGSVHVFVVWNAGNQGQVMYFHRPMRKYVSI
jgi:hypothetical protein